MEVNVCTVVAVNACLPLFLFYFLFFIARIFLQATTDQPKKIEIYFSFFIVFNRFTLFKCRLSVVLWLDVGDLPENLRTVYLCHKNKKTTKSVLSNLFVFGGEEWWMERTSAAAGWCQWTVGTARRYNLHPMQFVLSLPLVKDETVSRTKRTELSSF